MTGPYGDFNDFMRQHMPARSIMVRAKIARRLVKLASRIDRRPSMEYAIISHHPKAWNESR